jgi:hypothetical protein
MQVIFIRTTLFLIQVRKHFVGLFFLNSLIKLKFLYGLLFFNDLIKIVVILIVSSEGMGNLLPKCDVVEFL